MVKSFENLENILRDWAKENIERRLKVSFLFITEQTHGNIESIC